MQPLKLQISISYTYVHTSVKIHTRIKIAGKSFLLIIKPYKVNTCIIEHLLWLTIINSYFWLFPRTAQTKYQHAPLRSEVHINIFIQQFEPMKVKFVQIQ